MNDCTELDQSNLPSSGMMSSISAVSVAFQSSVPFITSRGSLPLAGFLTISTMAKLMSLRITKETRKPDQERKYSTSRAGILSRERNEIVIVKNGVQGEEDREMDFAHLVAFSFWTDPRIPCRP